MKNDNWQQELIYDLMAIIEALMDGPGEQTSNQRILRHNLAAELLQEAWDKLEGDK